MELQHNSLADGFIYVHLDDTFITVNQLYAAFYRDKVVSYWLCGKSSTCNWGLKTSFLRKKQDLGRNLQILCTSY